MSKFKRMIAATLAATICLTPSFAFQMNDITAHAASTTAGYSAMMNIPDTAITTASSKVKYGGGGYMTFTGTNWTASNNVYTCAANKSKKKLSTGWIASQMLRKYKAEFTVEIPKTYFIGKNSSTVRVGEVKELVSASVSFRTPGRQAGSEHSLPLTITEDIKNSTEDTYVYKCTSAFSSYGTEMKCIINCNSDSKDRLKSYETKVKYVVRSTGDIGYTNSDAYLSDGTGEKVHVQIDLQNSGISSAQYNKWLSMLVRFVNSVSDITGIQHKNIYVMFNEEMSSTPNCDHFVISGDGESVVVKMSPNYPINDTIKACQLDWGLMHELAHCYSFKTSNKTFAQAFNYNLDDVHTNVRAVTAMQNCSQLRSIEVVLDGVNVGNYKKAWYNAYLKKSNEQYFKMLYPYYKYTTRVSNGWVNLEKYFNGRVETALLNNDVVYGAIETINEGSSYTYGKYSSKPLIFETADTYRFINGFYYLCKNTSGYGATKANYKKFIKDFVGAEVYAAFIDTTTNESELWEAKKSNVKGDLTLDKKVNSNDITWLDGYMKNTKGLSPEGAFNADYNKDGYINTADRTAISNLIS